MLGILCARCMNYVRGSRRGLCKVGVLSKLSVSEGPSLFVLFTLSVCLAFPPVNGIQGGQNDFIEWRFWIGECCNGRNRWVGLFSWDELQVVFNS